MPTTNPTSNLTPDETTPSLDRDLRLTSFSLRFNKLATNWGLTPPEIIAFLAYKAAHFTHASHGAPDNALDFFQTELERHLTSLNATQDRKP